MPAHDRECRLYRTSQGKSLGKQRITPTSIITTIKQQQQQTLRGGRNLISRVAILYNAKHLVLNKKIMIQANKQEKYSPQRGKKEINRNCS